MRTLTTLLAPLALVALIGCAADADEDGLDKDLEAELGTDPNLADSDGDGLSDGDEHFDLGTDPTKADSDGDGLSDGEEVNDWGTDPLNEDSDGEGFLDGDEVDGGDPLDPAVWPTGTGQWPDNSDLLTEVDQGWDTGLQVYDFVMIDKDGEYLSAHQLAGHVVIIDYSAGWCGPCRAVAQTAEDFWQSHREEGLLLVHLMIDDNQRGGGVSDPGFTQSWASEYGLTFPVVTEERGTSYTGFARSGAYDGGIPWLVVLDRNLVVRAYGRGEAIENAALQLLDE